MDEGLFKIADTDILREEIWLLGQPPIRDYLRFVRDIVVGGATCDRRLLCDDWRTANDYYTELETSEAGLAETVECFDLDPALGPLAESIMGDPRFRLTFDTVPTSFGMVELEKLVIFQPHVTRHYAHDL